MEEVKKERKEIERENHFEEMELRDDYDDDDSSPSSSTQISKRVIQPWNKQITIRGLIVSTLIGSVYSVIVMKLNLTTGLVPNLNVSAALLAFLFVRSWTKLIQKAGFLAKPFTRQENTMIQTCAVACYSIAIGGGFGSYLLGLNRTTFELSGGAETVGNSPSSVKEPALGWMIGFLFVVCFVGLFALIPLRKIMIIDLELRYPTGLATGVLINGFHSQGDKMAKKQMAGFMKYFSVSFLWAFFNWFYTGKTECGFAQFPTFGLQAWKQTFYFDFSLTYVGAGMICSHLVNLSLLLGAVLSYGLMWPLLDQVKGDWFPRAIAESSMRSLYGYKVFLSVALILGDGLYNFVKIMGVTVISMHGKIKSKKLTDQDGKKPQETLKQNEVFLRENIPMWIGFVGYGVFSIMSIIVVPILFPQLKWYYVIVAYTLAPSLAFCNAYGAGLTDINMAYNYGKVALFTLAALSGKQNGVAAALAGCGLIKSVVSVSCILMQDFKTAHYTQTSPRAMFISQVIGTVIGCITAPLSFFLFYKAFDIGNLDGEFKAPYALIYRNMAILGVQGFSALPQHCLQLCYGFFGFAVAVNLVRDLSPGKIGKFMPLPTCMALPFLVGANFAIDMCVGTLIVFVWQKVNRKRSEFMVPAVASGLICGEGLWILPAAILALAKVTPPICMKFLAS